MKHTNPSAGKKVFHHSKKAFTLFTLALLLFSSFLILNRDAEAQQLVCPTRFIEQATNDPGEDGFQPSTTPDGNLIAFSSRSNINGGNPDNNNEIYLYNTITKVFTQITDIPGTSSLPSINADGTRIAFRTTADINGGNPDGNDDVYLATCLNPAIARKVPTLSEWGLIAMAGILGIVGFMVMRRRRVSA